jgi:hypothetical protein
MSRIGTADTRSMAHDSELDRLTAMLGQCLGRIDESAYRVQQVGDGADGAALESLLEEEMATLNELVTGVVDAIEPSEQCEVRPILAREVDACLAKVGMPIVVRMQLAPKLGPVRCAGNQLASAMQRALALATGRMRAGDELAIHARDEGETVVVEFECNGGKRDRNVHQRAITLCEFVAGFGGHCKVDVDEQKRLLIALELPKTTVFGDR